MAVVYIAHSRSLLDKAIRYAEKLRDEDNMVFVPGKRIKVKDEKKKFLPEQEIYTQK